MWRIGLLLAVLGTLSCGGDSTGPEIIDAPAGVTATMIPPSSARITWTASASAEGIKSYNVFRNGTKIGESATTIYIDDGLAELTLYRYAVSANGVSGVVSALSALSASASITPPDLSSPRVVLSIPAAGAVSVAPSSTIDVAFSEDIDRASLNPTTFSVKTAQGAVIPGTISYLAATSTATFTPASAFTGGSNIEVKIAGVRDVTGNILNPAFTFAFTIRGGDLTPPTVVAATPTATDSNAPITVAPSVTFSEAMDPSSINTANITLADAESGAAIVGTVSYDAGANKAIFTPAAPLAIAARYVLTVSTGVKDLSGNALASTFFFSFFTVTSADTTPPTIVSRNPESGQSGVALNANVTMVFSESMNIFTINELTIRLARTSAPGSYVNAIVTHDTAAHSVTLRPTSQLEYNTSYTVSVTGAKDVPGNPLAGPSTWTFTTIPDTTPPTVTATSPVNGGTGILTTSVITVTFGERMDPTTINATTFTVRDNVTSTNVAGAVTYDASTSVATFKPTSALTANRAYTATVTTGAKDAAGNALAADTSFGFTTNQDGVAPTIIATSPVDGATGVPISTLVTVTFSEDMNPATIATATFIVNDAGLQADFPGEVTYDAATRVATFTPRGALMPGRRYIVVITTFARDIAGNGFSENTLFTFTTAP